jgi:hypothetical protein
MALAMRAFPSSKGWRVTNQKWATPARITGASPFSENQSKNEAISLGKRSAAGASKWMISLPIGPEHAYPPVGVERIKIRAIVICYQMFACFFII